MKKIDGSPKNLKQLLLNTKYSINYYQREYLWQRKQIEELIEDLTSEFLEFYNPSHARSDVQDYGTYFMAQYYGLQPIDKKGALTNLESAITYMLKSYQLDPTDQNTTFKLSFCYWNKGDCENAWKYYDICKELGGQPITEDYTKDLMKKCKRKK